MCNKTSGPGWCPVVRKLINLRTFAPKSSYGEIVFISHLELGHKVLTPKMEKKIEGHRPCFGENGSGKMP